MYSRRRFAKINQQLTWTVRKHGSRQTGRKLWTDHITVQMFTRDWDRYEHEVSQMSSRCFRVRRRLRSDLLETTRWKSVNGPSHSANQQNKYCTKLDRKHLTLSKRKCFSPVTLSIIDQVFSLPCVHVRTSGRSFSSGCTVMSVSAPICEQRRTPATSACKQRPLLNS